jgi:hypothetical protein
LMEFTFLQFGVKSNLRSFSKTDVHGVHSIVVTYFQFDSNIRVLYVFLDF